MPGLWLLALLPAVPEANTEPPCFAHARALLARVEAVPMHRRGKLVDLALRREPRALLCGQVEQRFFAEAPPVPAGCQRGAPERCPVDGGLEVAPELRRDAGADLYWRTQAIASRLARQRLLSPAHERLLSTLLLSAALTRERH